MVMVELSCLLSSLILWLILIWCVCLVFSGVCVMVLWLLLVEIVFWYCV